MYIYTSKILKLLCIVDNGKIYNLLDILHSLLKNIFTNMKEKFIQASYIANNWYKNYCELCSACWFCAWASCAAWAAFISSIFLRTIIGCTSINTCIILWLAWTYFCAQLLMQSSYNIQTNIKYFYIQYNNTIKCNTFSKSLTSSEVMFRVSRVFVHLLKHVSDIWL